MIRPPSARDRMRRAEHRMRTLGYDDGYAGRPARYSLLVYQRSYVLGRDARRETLVTVAKESA